ncbi:MAG: hypothetical protein AB1813_18680 [Verrucomicrobiota bacterium]
MDTMDSGFSIWRLWARSRCFLAFCIGWTLQWDSVGAQTFAFRGETPGFQGGWATRVAVHNGRAYVEVGSTIMIVSVAVSERPTILGQMSHPSQHFIEGMEVQWPYLCLALQADGLAIIDVADPVQPRMVSNLDTPGEAKDLALTDNFAYVADSTSGLQVISIADARQPKIISTIPTTAAVTGVAAGRGYLFIAHGSTGLIEVRSLADPAAPMPVATLKLTGGLSRLRLDGTHLYAAVGDSVHIIDIQDPSNPALRRSFGSSGMSSFAVRSGFASIATKDNGVTIFDVREATAPKALMMLGTKGSPNDSARDVAMESTYVYVAEMDGGLRVFDINKIAEQPTLGSVETSGAANAIDLVGSTAYVGTSSGVRIISFTNPTAPQTIGSITLGGNIVQVRNIGTHLLAASPSSLYVLDIVNPAAPLPIASVSVPLQIGSFDVAGPYVVTAGRSLSVIDISTLSAPEVIGSIPGSWNIGTGNRSIRVAGNAAYVGFSNPTLTNFALQVFDISVPTSPVRVKTVGTGAALGNLFLEGDQLYSFGSTYVVSGQINEPLAPISLNTWFVSAAQFVRGNSNRIIAKHGSRLSILDIAPPDNVRMEKAYWLTGTVTDLEIKDSLLLTALSSGVVLALDTNILLKSPLVSELDTRGVVNQIQVVDDVAFLAEDQNGLKIVDVRDPAQPVEVGHYETRDWTLGLDIVGTTAYLADGHSGLKVVDVSDRKRPRGLGRVLLPRQSNFGQYEAWSVKVRNGFAFLAAEAAGLCVVDVTDPTQPRLVSQFLGNGRVDSR